MRFKVIAGNHIGPDKTQDPVTIKDPRTGVETEKYPSRTFKTGEIVEEDYDMVAKHGFQKFERVGDGPERNRRNRPARSTEEEKKSTRPEVPTNSAPGGQVSSGYPMALSGPVPGEAPADAKTIERHDDVLKARRSGNAPTPSRDRESESDTAKEREEVSSSKAPITVHGEAAATHGTTSSSSGHSTPGQASTHGTPSHAEKKAPEGQGKTVHKGGK
jgi:hypothetical protein